MVKVALPVAKLRPKPGIPVWESAWEPSKLPRKDIILACSARYFKEVHSIYWLYSSEDFHTRLEATDFDSYAQQTNSWLCSLHSIVALGSLCGSETEGVPDEQLAQSSLETAKLLTPKVCDEADLDSIRALILLVSNAT